MYICKQVLTSVVDIPEEVCDLNPSKVCRFTTRLVPSLTPDQQCTTVPKGGISGQDNFLMFPVKENIALF
jgi:hypothetical protein